MNHKVRWNTDKADFEAEDFYAVINGIKYFGNGRNLSFTSNIDPNNPNQSTMEAVWLENMSMIRLTIRISADDKSWWVSDIRTKVIGLKGGEAQYKGEFLKTNLGNDFKGNMDLVSNENTKRGWDRLHFGNFFIKLMRKLRPTSILPSPTVSRQNPSQTPSISAKPEICPRKSAGDAGGANGGPCDGVIDGFDYSIWLHSQCHPGLGQVCSSLRADFNGDGNIDDNDLGIWRDNRDK